MKTSGGLRFQVSATLTLVDVARSIVKLKISGPIKTDFYFMYKKQVTILTCSN